MAASVDGARKTAGDANVVSINSRTKSAGAHVFNEQTGGPPSDGGDSWKASVESRLSELRTDVRHLLIGGAVIALALAGAGWGIYTSAMNQMSSIQVKQQELSGKFDTMDARINGKFEALGVRLDDQQQRRASK
jgi:hypothetical protein